MSGPPSSGSGRPTNAQGRGERRRERGAVSWVSLLLVAILVGGGYLGWVWTPLYLEYLEVKHVVGEHMNEAVKNTDDAQLRRKMVEKIQRLREVTDVDASGREVKVPAIQLDESAVEWERDAQTKSLHVSFAYERPFVYPLLDKPAVAVFSIDRTSDITLPVW